jgi:hypothetical protein
MHQRLRVYAIGLAAVALLIIGVAIQQGVFAQDDSDDSNTPAATTTQTGDEFNNGATDANAEAALQYKSFIETVATNLHVSDPMVVDNVVKTVLKQVVDEQVGSGAMSDADAEAVRAQIDSGNVAPLIFGKADQGDTGGSGTPPPSDDSTQQDDGSGAPAAPTEDDDGYDYGY